MHSRVKIYRAMTWLNNNTNKFFWYSVFSISIFIYQSILFFMPVCAETNEIGQIVRENHSDLVLRGQVWYGNASWYGPKFHGRRTSNGERFNKNELTAAHRTLPFNTIVLVTNLLKVQVNEKYGQVLQPSLSASGHSISVPRYITVTASVVCVTDKEVRIENDARTNREEAL